MVRRSRGDAGPDPGGGRMTVVDRNDQTKEEGSATTVLAARKPSVDEPELLRLAEAYKAKLQSWTESYQQEWPRRYRAKVEEQVEASLGAKGNGGRVVAAAEPDSEIFGITYPWWNILVLGPLQAVAPGGPFRPSKIVRTGEDAFMIVVLWRNPVPLPGGPNRRPRRSWRPTSGRSTERRSTSRRSPTGPIWPRRRAPSAPGSSTRS